MSTRLVIEGNSVYEIDEECLECSQKMKKEKLEEKCPGREWIEHRGNQTARQEN